MAQVQYADMARPRVIVVMPAYNAARTLEKTYRDLPKDAVDEVILVSVNFRRSVVYGFGTLWTVLTYALYRARLTRPAQFSLTLSQIISKYHAPAIVGDASVGRAR